MLRVNSMVLNRAAQSLRLLPHSSPASVQIGEWPNGLSHLHAGSQLQLPVYPHLLLCWFPITRGLWLSGVMWCHDLHVTWVIVKEGCTCVSLTLSSKTIQIQQQEQVKMAGDRLGCNGWPWFAKCLIMPLHSTTHCWDMPSCPLNQLSDFPCTICWVQSSHAMVGIPMFHLGQRPNNYPHQALQASQSQCPGCGCYHMLTAMRSHWWEPGGMWRPKVEELPMMKWLSLPEVLLLHDTPYSPIYAYCCWAKSLLVFLFSVDVDLGFNILSVNRIKLIVNKLLLSSMWLHQVYDEAKLKAWWKLMYNQLNLC